MRLVEQHHAETALTNTTTYAQRQFVVQQLLMEIEFFTLLLTLNFQLTRFVARDSVTGFNVKDLRLRAGVSKGVAHVKDITVQQESTVLKFDSATVVLPSKKKGRKFSFQTSTIKGRTELRDISRPFAPVLKNFKMPLELSVVFSGTDSTLTFKNVHVNTPDKLLTITADGGIDHLKEKEKLEAIVKDENQTVL